MKHLKLAAFAALLTFAAGSAVAETRIESTNTGDLTQVGNFTNILSQDQLDAIQSIIGAAGEFSIEDGAVILTLDSATVLNDAEVLQNNVTGENITGETELNITGVIQGANFTAKVHIDGQSGAVTLAPLDGSTDISTTNNADAVNSVALKDITGNGDLTELAGMVQGAVTALEYILKNGTIPGAFALNSTSNNTGDMSNTFRGENITAANEFKGTSAAIGTDTAIKFTVERSFTGWTDTSFTSKSSNSGNITNETFYVSLITGGKAEIVSLAKASGDAFTLSNDTGEGNWSINQTAESLGTNVSNTLTFEGTVDLAAESKVTSAAQGAVVSTKISDLFDGSASYNSTATATNNAEITSNFTTGDQFNIGENGVIENMGLGAGASKVFEASTSSINYTSTTDVLNTGDVKVSFDMQSNVTGVVGDGTKLSQVAIGGNYSESIIQLDENTPVNDITLAIGAKTVNSAAFMESTMTIDNINGLGSLGIAHQQVGANSGLELQINGVNGQTVTHDIGITGINEANMQQLTNLSNISAVGPLKVNIGQIGSSVRVATVKVKTP